MREPSSATPQARNVYRISALLLLALLPSIVVYIVLAAQSGAWQLYVIIADALFLAAVAGLSAALSRRGRAGLPAGLLLFGVMVAGAVASAMVAGLGLPLGLVIVLLTTQVATQTLPQNWAYRAIAASIVIALVMALLDSLGRQFQLVVPIVSSVILVLGAVVMLVLAFAIARQFQSYPLRTKLLLVFISVTLVPMGVLVTLTDRSTRQVLTDAANQSLASAARQATDRLDAFIAANLESIRAESQIAEWREYLEADEQTLPGSDVESDVLNILSALQARDPRIVSYALVDLQGRVRLDSRTSNAGASEADRDYFQGVLQYNTAFVSPVAVDAAGEVSLTFAGPVVDDAGELFGVLRFVYDARVLQDLMAQYNGLAGANSFGVLVDRDGSVLAHGLAPELRFQSASTGLRLGLINLVDQPFFQATDAATGDKQNQVAAAQMRRRPWTIAFFQLQDVFLLAGEQQTRGTTVLAILVAGAIALIALGLAQVLTGPIARLRQVAVQITGGDLAAQARAEADDEIGELAMAFNNMTAQMRVLIDSLELQVEARTAQLQASADVGRAVASILDPHQLLREVVNLITDRFGFYYTAVFTPDEAGKYAVLRAATGEAGRELLRLNHQLEIGGQSMVGYVTAQRKPRIALDVGEEAIRFNNPLLPNTRSEVALPLIAGGKMLGALDVQSVQEAAFDETSAAVLQSMADQIAIALNNAALYSESQTNVNALNSLLEMSRDIAGSRSLDDLRVRTLKHVQSITGVDSYYVGLVDESYREIRFILSVRPGLTTDEIITRPYGSGRTEYVIQTRRTLRMTSAEASLRLSQLGLKTWEKSPGAFLGVPIVVGDRVLGMIGLQNFEPNAAFTDLQERLTTALANQLGATLENLRLVDETQRALADLDAANRRLTSEAWARYMAATGAIVGEWRSGQWERLPPGAGFRRFAQISESSPAEQSSESLSAPSASSADAMADGPLTLTLPLRVRGEKVGEFNLVRPVDGHEWMPDELAFAQSLIDQVGQAIETARLLEETERLAGRDRLINSITSRVRQTVNMDTILKTAVNELGRSLGAARVFARIGAVVGASHDPPEPPPAAGNGKDDDHA